LAGQRNERMWAIKGNVNQFRSFAVFAAHMDRLRNCKARNPHTLRAQGATHPLAFSLDRLFLDKVKDSDTITLIHKTDLNENLFSTLGGPMKVNGWFVRSIKTIFSLILLFSILFSSTPTDTSAEGRTGAWLDSLTFKVDDGNPIDAIKSGAIDLFAQGLSSTFAFVEDDPDLETETSNGLYYELTINPAVLTDASKLNPFSDKLIREAMNRLIDRDHIIDAVFGGIGNPKFTPILHGYPDYVRYATKVAELESQYAYNMTTAGMIISSRMGALGAVYQDGKWHYNGELVTIIFIIRNDSGGVRIPIGDYIANQLESIGFTIDRKYMSGSEASPYWLGSDPAEGQWHLYTGAWSTTMIDRDEGDNFQFFHSPDSYYGFLPLWQAYNPSQEFRDLSNALAYQSYSNMAERDVAFEGCLELALEDSFRVWLVDGENIFIRDTDTTAAYDMAAGLNGTLYPFTIRFLGMEGGDMNIGIEELFIEPLNPIGGSNWEFDYIPLRATRDHAFVYDPTNGLAMPQRVESATVTAEAGLPIYKTLDWVSLDFQPTITVPTNAWSDWDALNQEFITAAEKYPDGTTAKIKSVVTYPSDLFSTVKWHDGSPLSVGDFVMEMIFQADRSKTDSAIYDEFVSNPFDNTIKGIRIISEDPLTIETYTDSWQLDAELCVTSWWPSGSLGPTPWHTTALAAVIEAGGYAAFTSSKADASRIEWINYLYGPTLGYMDQELSSLTDYIPYAHTLGDYITAGEAELRWDNLRAWYDQESHFWVGSGPFYIDSFNWTGKLLTLRRFEDFPDEAGKWDAFIGLSTKPVIFLNHVKGGPGSFFTIFGQNYPPSGNGSLLINGHVIATGVPVDVNGNFEFILSTDEADIGGYEVTFTVNPSSTTFFRLVPTEPIHLQAGTGTIYAVPEGMAIYYAYLPMITR